MKWLELDFSASFSWYKSKAVINVVSRIEFFRACSSFSWFDFLICKNIHVFFFDFIRLIISIIFTIFVLLRTLWYLYFFISESALTCDVLFFKFLKKLQRSEMSISAIWNEWSSLFCFLKNDIDFYLDVQIRCIDFLNHLYIS